MAITISGSGITSANIADGTIAAADLANTYLTPTGDGSSLTNMAAGGKVLQVVSTLKADQWSTTSGGYVDVTGFSVSITPASASSKFLVFVDSQISVATTGWLTSLRLMRDSTPIGNASFGSNMVGFGFYQMSFTYGQNTVGISYLDTPNTTSPVTYKIQQGGASGQTQYINQTAEGTNNTASSSITVMEIGV